MNHEQVLDKIRNLAKGKSEKEFFGHPAEAQLAVDVLEKFNIQATSERLSFDNWKVSV